MNQFELNRIEKHFTSYYSGFAEPDGSMHPFLTVKISHSFTVARESRTIAEDLNWSANDCNLAEAIGILHDIGRFSQFDQYQTFSDAHSVNHGERGWEVARDIGILNDTDAEETEIALDCIRYHNRRNIPDDIPNKTRPFLLLIRDADKLDILKIVLESLAKNGFEDLIDMLPNISNDMIPSPLIADEIRAHKSASMNNVASVGDFMLLQLSWVYSFNYSPTYKHLIERGLLQDLSSHIKGGLEIRTLADEMIEYARQRRHCTASQ